MYKQDLVLNNLQWLICHKTKPNQTTVVQHLYDPSKTLQNFRLILIHMAAVLSLSCRSNFSQKILNGKKVEGTFQIPYSPAYKKV